MSCARIAMPTGGDKDIKPPKSITANPKDNTTNFHSNTFEVTFDEYIELDNVAQKLIVSPPLQSKPEVSSRLKTIRVKWNDTLRPNTTYIFDFADAIKDYTEGNHLGNFSYSFSTGEIIDSLSYFGKAVEAFTLKPVSNKLVILYNTERGRAIMHTEQPDYVTRLDTFGVFRFRNIASGQYNLLILDDKNQNLYYDLPTEGIAFSDKPVTPFFSKDSVIKADSLPIYYFFEPPDTILNIDKKLLSDRKLQIVFSQPPSDSVHIDFADTTLQTINVFSAKRDTLTCFAIGNRTFDTLNAEIVCGNFKETLLMYYFQKRKSKTDSTFAIIPPNNTLDYFDKLRLELPFPCEENIEIKACLIEDSICDSITFISHTTYLESRDLLQEGKHYKLVLSQGIFDNLISQSNDSLTTAFSVTTKEDYGRITLNFDSVKPLIIILEDLNGKEIARKNIADAQCIFSNLKENKYKVKIIDDKSRNGKWDGGDFDAERQPESVKYYDKVLNVRKNWEIEEKCVSH